MPLIPVPGGRGLIHLAVLAILLVIVLLLSPAIVIWSLFPTGREFLLRLLAELRTWTRDVLGTSTDHPADSLASAEAANYGDERDR